MLDRLTITGPDDNTNIDRLLQLSEQFPFLEWAILYSPTREGSNRYPSQAWRTNFEDACKGTRVQRAMHLCGNAVKTFVLHGPEATPRSNYQRVQLNFSALSKNWTPVMLEQMVLQCERAEKGDGAPQQIIIQANRSNKEVLPLFDRLGNKIHVLYDSSGGNGKVIDTFEGPILGKYCGYAGGITPDNALALYQRITCVNDHSFWMDLETGVRTKNDQWDQHKVNTLVHTLSFVIGR